MKTIAAVFGLPTVLVPLALALPVQAGGPTVTAPEPVIAPVEPYVAPGIDWTGAYAGGQLGYGDVDSSTGALEGHGMIGGVHAGYRWDMGSFVAGAELDFDTSNIDLGTTAGDSLDNVLRAKLSGGAKLGNSLLYGTFGAARANASVGGADLTDTGYFLGAGLTYALGSNWTVGGEVLEHRFGDFDGSGVELDATTVTARVGFRF